MSSTPKKRRNTPRYLTLSRLHFARPHFEGYVRWLEARNYTKSTTSMLTIYLGHWTDWMHGAGFDLSTIHSGYAASVPAFRAMPNYSMRLRSGALFVLFLEEQGIVNPLPKPSSPSERWPILGEFRDWMLRNRGVLDSSLDTYQNILVHMFLVLGDAPEAYSAHAIRDFVLGRAGIRKTKFGKSRMVPLHASVMPILDRYMELRLAVVANDDHLFLSEGKRKIYYSVPQKAFHEILAIAGIAPGRSRRPRIHDLRHTFATRVLEKSGAGRDAIARNAVALMTYMGHSNLRYTYWYLHRTPELLAEISAAAEELLAEGGS